MLLSNIKGLLHFSDTQALFGVSIVRALHQAQDWLPKNPVN